MKKLLLTVVTAGVLLASCTPRNRVVENPLIGAANTMTLDFPKIELSDTATVLHVNAYFRPHNWIRIDAGAYLMADGQKYMLQGSEGIEPDSLFWMPDSGEASFVLKFGPLPAGTKSFDFIESDCDDCFKLYGVDLTGRKEYHPEGLPRELQKTPKDGPVPDPVFAVGETTMNIHLLGYREGMNKNIAVYVNSLLNDQKENLATVDPETGTATVRFEQYGTATAFIVYGSTFGQCWMAPGETIDVYMDLSAGGRAIVQRRDKQDEPAARGVYTTGIYADLNAQYARNGEHVSMNCYTGDFADYRMSADEYTQMVVSKYKALADSVSRSPMPRMIKELSLLSLQQETLCAIAMSGFLLSHNYRHVNNMWDYRVEPDYEFASLKPEHYAAVCGLFDINNPKLMMGESMSDYVQALCYSRTGVDWAALTHATEGFVSDLPKAMQMTSKAENNELTQEDLDLLHSLKEPFYAEACEAMQARVRKELEKVQDIRIETTPDVAVDKLFDAIIAPCKGKVVLVDFWNTWCSPCRNALKANEPLKSGELKSDDLMWIYIANETSPLAAYKTGIAEIQGKHYRLNAEQWQYICEKFGIDGIPSYVLVDRDGSYKLRNDFRDHGLMKKTLKGMIE